MPTQPKLLDSLDRRRVLVVLAVSLVLLGTGLGFVLQQDSPTPTTPEETTTPETTAPTTEPPTETTTPPTTTEPGVTTPEATTTPETTTPTTEPTATPERRPRRPRGGDSPSPEVSVGGESNATVEDRPFPAVGLSGR
jgi:cytoskeletal protein RodZ